MDRREFVLAGALGLVSSRLALLADDSFVKDVKLQRKDVGHEVGNHLNVDLRNVYGWEMNVEEDDHTLFDFIITNKGPAEVRVVHCQPYTFGPWKILERLGPVGVGSGKEIKHSWRCCNDSNFFFIEINAGGNWTPVDSRGSVGRTQNGNKSAYMEWAQPQPVAIEIRGRKGAESGHC
jgi:hypothetical protein